MRDQVRISAKIRGYADRQSVAQGQSVQFCISNLSGFDLLELPIRIVRLDLHDTPVASGLAAVRAQGVPTDRPWENTNWDVSYRLDVGRDWRPGVYVARVGDVIDDTPDIFFVVRNAKPGSTTPIVVQIPTTTINAYNNWGGASLYEYNSNSSPTPAVSFNRPQHSDSNWKRGYGFADEWNARIKAFVYWMEAVGFEADFITNNDLHEDKDLLQHYQLFISIGHDEYWSREMRDNFDAFIALGGNAAIFGGNTCYWQIRLEPDEKTGAASRLQVCYKNADLDPIEDPNLKTVRWRDVGYPENRSFGAGFAGGAWKGNGDPAPFRVHQPKHWAFYQTGLREGDEFGNLPDETLLCYETSGCDSAFDERGRPVPTGADGTPLNYSILAFAELPNWGTPGNAAMGIFTTPLAGGSVFNAATTDWARGLETCISNGDHFRTVTAKISRNVIEHLTPMRFVGKTIAIDGGGESHIYRPVSRQERAMSRLTLPTAFKAYTSAVDSDLVPIYRFRSGLHSKERLSRSSASRGWEPDGIAFYGYKAPADDRVAIYRIRWADPIDCTHERYSANPEVAKSERMAGIAFYGAK